MSSVLLDPRPNPQPRSSLPSLDHGLFILLMYSSVNIYLLWIALPGTILGTGDAAVKNTDASPLSRSQYSMMGMSQQTGHTQTNKLNVSQGSVF